MKKSAFGASGFGKALLTHVHASPSKDQETILVKEGSCPMVGERDPFPVSKVTKPDTTGTGTGTGIGTGTGTGTGTDTSGRGT